VPSYEVHASGLRGAGMHGFAEAGKRLPYDDSLYIGTAKGYRWWQIQLPFMQDQLEHPSTWRTLFSETSSPWGEHLRGQNGQAWPAHGERNTEYIATCGAGLIHKPPAENCGCGFWAYWSPALSTKAQCYSEVSLQGVIEGYGDVIYGTQGFRAEKCRIVALSPKLAVLSPYKKASPGQSAMRLRRKAFWEVLPEVFPGVRLYRTEQEMVNGEGIDPEGSKHLNEDTTPALPF
jgi:hypothetical protein